MKKTHTFCTKPSHEDEIVGRACKVCGHTNIVHPGAHNPSLQACLLCELENLTRPETKQDSPLSEEDILRLAEIHRSIRRLRRAEFRTVPQKAYVEAVEFLLDVIDRLDEVIEEEL